MVFLLGYSHRNTYICNMLDRFKEILKDNGLTGKHFCEMLLGLSYGSYRSATRKGSKVVPKWVRGFVLGYELGVSMVEKKNSDADAS